MSCLCYCSKKDTALSQWNKELWASIAVAKRVYIFIVILISTRNISITSMKSSILCRISVDIGCLWYFHSTKRYGGSLGPTAIPWYCHLDYTSYLIMASCGITGIKYCNCVFPSIFLLSDKIASLKPLSRMSFCFNIFFIPQNLHCYDKKAGTCPLKEYHSCWSVIVMHISVCLSPSALSSPTSSKEQVRMFGLLWYCRRPASDLCGY